MTFSERQKLEKEYYKWLEKNKNVKPCPFSLITFLQINGNLVSKEKHEEIDAIEMAFEMVCLDYLKLKFPKTDYTGYKPKSTMRWYKQKAEKLVEVKNEDIQIQGGIY